jgi:hypothetical protein
MKAFAVVLLALIATLVSHTSQSVAEEPTPIGLAPAVEIRMRGPTEAAPGATAIYRVDYRVLSRNLPEWEFRAYVERPLTFVSAEVVRGDGICRFESMSQEDGAQGSTPEVRGIVFCAVGSAAKPQGAVDIAAQIDSTFEGDFTFTAIVPGTSLDTGDSDCCVTTSVSASAAVLPDTGTGARNDRMPVLITWLGMAGASLIAFGAGALRALRQRSRGSGGGSSCVR